ncbi:MAG: DegT/DnrJ/EryC1/StrS aminotransferase family protein [Methylobacter sp.]|uniref:DegT/DnrJ/EryC1/StrS aminotransferase family protein n=1 Tax=Methylobacter sp. TaxID=2051955 RepID=UPI0027312B92|nr:DegT/DnrJ/EryC1/StrS aminotransferase family protein [Methylobacter sp.]MDP1665877.1 DegT/DnrJ/EryC1/StrS aminotransferase family protein [Methylobacter sp.]
MKFTLDKIPRGMIYHKIIESVGYFMTSFFMPLDDHSTIKKFESKFAEYCDREYCVAFPFARTAIYFALKNLNLSKGSEVILPPITIKGIVDVILALDLVPVYVDWDIDTLNFQLDDLHRKTSPKTKAVVITTLFGLVPDMKVLVDFFRDKGIFIIEDFSQCLNGSFDGKRVGTFGDVGIYSCSSIKTLDTLGGGLAITSDTATYEALKKSQAGLSLADRKFLIKKAWVNLVRNVATTRLIFSLAVFPLLQIMRRFNPEATLKQTGSRNKDRLPTLPKVWFSSYSSFQANIGLAHIDGVSASDQIRIDNANFLKARCDLDKFPKTTKSSANVYWQLVMVQDPKKAQEVFARHGIDTATTSLELVAALEKYPNKTMTPVAEKIYHNGIFLPCFPGLSNADLERIVNATNQLI